MSDHSVGINSKPLSIQSILSESWRLVRGLKLRIFLMVLCLLVSIITIILALNVMGYKVSDGYFLVSPIFTFIGWLFMSTTVLLGVRQSTGKSIQLRAIFKDYLNHKWECLGLIALSYVLGEFILPAITTLLTIAYEIYHFTAFYLAVTTANILINYYVGFAMLMMVPLVIEKNESLSSGIINGFKGTAMHFFKIICIMLIMVFITIVSIIPLGLGLIWTLPMLYVAYGIIFREIYN